MKKDFIVRVNEFLESKDLIRISMISVDGKNELVLQNRKNGKFEIYDMFIFEMNENGRKKKGVLTKENDCKFAICFEQNGKVAFGLNDLKVYMGFPESNVKFMAMAVKEEKSIIILYDSFHMEKPFIHIGMDDKKSQNLKELYKTISKLGFTDGDTATYYMKETEI